MNKVIYYANFLQKKKYTGGDYMCDTLNKIRNKSPYELLDDNEIPLNPPVDISKLLEKMGVSTIARDFSDIEETLGKSMGSILGAAFTNNQKLAIFYKKSDTLHRKKFTIAHELGHCCLHCPDDESSHIQFRFEPFITLLSKEELEKEKEANIFAGQLLIPKESLMKQYEKMIVPSLTRLSEIFDVSTSVMAARLDYLKLPYYKDSETEIIL